MAFISRVSKFSFTLAKTSRIITPFCVRAMSTRFVESHEYITLNGNIGTVGITDHAASALGDVVFVDLPSVGKKLKAGDTCGSVESVKAASDVYSPVQGEVVEVNSTLETSPETVNASPFEKGWFIKIKVDDKGVAEFNKLMDEKTYKQRIAK